MENGMRRAVCVLMVTADDKVVAVSRRDDESQWGMPGGKVDPGETPLQAVVRETFEEIGYRLSEEDLEAIYEGVCGGGNGTVPYLVTTFVYKRGAPSVSSLVPEPGLALDAVPASVLLRPDSSPFAAYNQQAFFGYAEYQRKAEH